MNLLQIFPDAPVMSLNGKDYALEYTMQSELELQKDYGDKYHEVAKGFLEMSTQDIVNFLFAGLLHTDLIDGYVIDKKKRPWRINREGAKDFIASQLSRNQRPLYALAIGEAWINSMVTPEQLEMLEVMSAGSEKKTNPVTL